MSGPDWYRWYPAKWASGVIGLTPEQRGVYMDVINIILDRGDCPADEEYLKLACNCQIRRLRRILRELVDDGKLSLEEGCYVQTRAKLERNNSETFSKLQRNRVAKRWKNKGITDTIPGDTITTTTTLDSESSTSRQNPDTNLGAPDQQLVSVAPNGACRPNGRRSSSDAFEEFWDCWDIQGAKRDKTAARRKYDAAIKAGIEHTALCDGVRQYMAWARRNRVELRFIKHPSTWLNKGCWSDELPDRNHQESTDEWAERIARETADEFAWRSH